MWVGGEAASRRVEGVEFRSRKISRTLEPRVLLNAENREAFTLAGASAPNPYPSSSFLLLSSLELSDTKVYAP